MKFVRNFLCCGFILACGATAASASTAAETPAEKRMVSLLEVLNKLDREELRKYIETSFAPAFLASHSVDEHLSIMESIQSMSHGFVLHSFTESDRTSATALVQQKLTETWATLQLKTESEAPWRIAGLGLRPTSQPPDAVDSAPLSRSDAAQELDSFVKKLARQDAFSGAVLLAHGGDVLYQSAFGEANKDFGVANAVDTRFNLGSMNKMFTAVAIVQLMEAGKLSLQDPLARFLPEFPTPQDAAKIRIEHLLTHTSGLGSYFNEKFMNSSRTLYRTVDQMMQLAQGDKPAFEPGTRWQYSNTGFLVLGAVIEKVTGQSYYDYVRRHIYEPAGMSKTDCYELDLVNPNLAVGYSKENTDDGKTRYRNNIFQHVIRGGPAGGGYSTAGDLLRFANALRSGKLLKEENTRLVWTPKPNLHSPQYGFGFAAGQDGIVGHSGGFAGINSNLDIFLDSGYVGVVLSNYSRAMMPVRGRIRQLVGRLAKSED